MAPKTLHRVPRYTLGGWKHCVVGYMGVLRRYGVPYRLLYRYAESFGATPHFILFTTGRLKSGYVLSLVSIEELCKKRVSPATFVVSW